MSCIIIKEQETTVQGLRRQEFEVITKVAISENDNEHIVSFWIDKSLILMGQMKERTRAVALVRYLLTKNEVVSIPFDMTKLDKFIEEEQ